MRNEEKEWALTEERIRLMKLDVAKRGERSRYYGKELETEEGFIKLFNDDKVYCKENEDEIN